ncbi:glutathione peroxidase [Novosphingobium aerophilum]|uniref:glutathione peroxidase n=1 Tax=Novosphingobium TaxID=165696 RepID=UPI0006C85954|nr:MULTISPECIES: glutathione peroxidase [unclassified Novosphingobium]KPH67574.1 glutathione peroxidase [Novosphingobium sp. ST904]MPS68799.1 glutathione peroxidase [Novosphingobium sp.]TCM37784.1 glutathione peroxidase [Novosphingobium sp. ST904]WRT93481.1 glutathione peroxidase [Novosphingobium sp. RL4]
MAADITAIPLTRIDGSADSLANHEGKVLLVVNVASKCGLTPQYEGLEKLYSDYKAQGLEVLGFPANDFGAQEPGTDEEIVEFCQLNYGVSFPLFTKADVTGEAKQPLYAALTEAVPTKQGDVEGMKERFKGYGMTPNDDPEVLWNFEKFLISRDGEVVGRFAPGTAPQDPLLVDAIEAELNR